MALISSLLSSQPFIVLDGGLATELESRGADLNDSLWSAKLLSENPELIRQVHLDYFLAGADVAVTTSYQASFRGLQDRGFNKTQSRELVQLSVELARQAKEEAQKLQPGRRFAIAGSVGPYGAFLANGAEYRGDYDVPADEMKAFHFGRMQTLVKAGVDILALETMPSFPEILALLELLKEFPNTNAWVSCTVRDERALSDGTSLSTVVKALNECDQVIALGVNCIPESNVTATLNHMKTITSKPLIAYPNSGELYDAADKVWKGERVEGQRLEARVREWRQAGARFIGGCCRTGPEDIKTIKSVLLSTVRNTTKEHEI